jgi:hypothetical protein
MSTATYEVVQRENIEYGGLTWEHKPKLSQLTYFANQSGVGRFRVHQYPLDDLDACSGKWSWHVDFDWLVDFEQRPKVLYMNVGGVLPTLQDAMLACLDARGQFIEDMRQLLKVLCPGDEYAQGHRAGQEEIKQRLIDLLQ